MALNGAPIGHFQSFVIRHVRSLEMPILMLMSLSVHHKAELFSSPLLSCMVMIIRYADFHIAMMILVRVLWEFLSKLFLRLTRTQ